MLKSDTKTPLLYVGFLDNSIRYPVEWSFEDNFISCIWKNKKSLLIIELYFAIVLDIFMFLDSNCQYSVYIYYIYLFWLLDIIIINNPLTQDIMEKL